MIAAARLLPAAVAVVLVAGSLSACQAAPANPEAYAQDALKRLDKGYYATGTAWDAERARVAATTKGATDMAAVHAELKRATAVAGGKHSSFDTPAEAKADSSEAAAQFRAPSVVTAAGVSTIVVPEYVDAGDERSKEYAAAAARGIGEAAPGTCGWVVDLRGNTGGQMRPMLSGLAPLLPNGPAVMFRLRDGSTGTVTIQDDGAGFGGRTAVKIPAVAKVSGQPIAVLYDDHTASSGEVAAIAFRGLPQARSFGTATAGYTSANETITLSDGARLVLTTGIDVDRDGHSLDEQPLQPDEPTPAADAPAAAAAWLRAQGCPG